MKEVNEKYVRVMADYSSTGLWNAEGANVDLENYTLAPDTVKALKVWTLKYESNDDYNPPEERKNPLFDLKAFSVEGLAVARMIKRDLPDYEVVYFDEAKSSDYSGTDRMLDRLEYEYPVFQHC